MQEQLISLKTEKLAKQKGFSNIKTIIDKVQHEYVDSGGNGTGDYHFKYQEVTKEVTPTQSLLAKWLREKHKIFISSSTPTLKYGTENILEYEAFRIDTYNHISFNKNKQPKLSEQTWKGTSKYQYILNGASYTNTYFDTFEQAMEIALYEALLILPDKI